MPVPIRVQCPHCLVVLKLKTRAPLGKEVPCPTCERAFVAKQIRSPKKSHPPPDYEDFGPPADGLLDDDFDLQSAQTGKRKARKQKKKRASKRLKISLTLGVVFFVLAGSGIVIWSLVGKYFREINLAWLPEDANKISVMYVSDIWESETIKKFVRRQNLDGAKSRMKSIVGFGPADIKSYTLASNENKERLKIVRTHTALNKKKILALTPGYSEESHEGKSYYKIGLTAIYFPDENTAISGLESAVKRAIERGPKSKERDELKFVDGSYDMIIVDLDFKGTRPVIYKAFSKTSVTAIMDGISYSSGAEHVSRFECQDSEGAKSFVEEVKKNISDYKSRFSGSSYRGRDFSREVEPGVRWKDADLTSVEVSKSGKVAIVTYQAKIGSKTIAEMQFTELSWLRMLLDPRELFAIQFSHRNRLRIYLGTYQQDGDPFAAARDMLKDFPGIDPKWTIIYGRRSAIKI
ncbi:MAG: hypothetical protein IID45_02935, partial [Planctomycetes bacterium]|nr:hypothetical protein [Planctomycetota bacterium]